MENCNGRAINQCARGVIALFQACYLVFPNYLSDDYAAFASIHEHLVSYVTSWPLIVILSMDKPAAFSQELHQVPLPLITLPLTMSLFQYIIIYYIDVYLVFYE